MTPFRKKPAAPSPDQDSLSFDFVEEPEADTELGQEGDSMDTDETRRLDPFEEEAPTEVALGESEEAAEPAEEDFEIPTAEPPRERTATGSLGFGDLAVPVADFLIPTVFPLLLALFGMAWIEGDATQWRAPMSSPHVAALLWCFLFIANCGYYMVFLGLIGDSYGRLAFAPPPFLMPRPEAAWIVRRMLPNLALCSALVGALFLLARP